MTAGRAGARHTARFSRAAAAGVLHACCASTCRKGCSPIPPTAATATRLGWRLLGHTGVWFENSAEENLSPEPVTKGGESSRSPTWAIPSTAAPREPRRDPRLRPTARGAPPAGRGRRGAGRAGRGGRDGRRRCWRRPDCAWSALEAGPWRTKRDFVPDELGSAYYCRGGDGPQVPERDAALAAQQATSRRARLPSRSAA